MHNILSTYDNINSVIVCTVTTLSFNSLTYSDPDDDHAPASLLALNADPNTPRSFLLALTRSSFMQ